MRVLYSELFNNIVGSNTLLAFTPKYLLHKVMPLVSRTDTALNYLASCAHSNVCFLEYSQWSTPKEAAYAIFFILGS